MAFIEIRDGRYFAAMWYRFDAEGPYGQGADVLAAVWRDPGGRWHYVSRVRGYLDDQTWESEDLHVGVDQVLPVGTDEVAACSLADEAIGKLAFSGPVQKMILRTDRAQKIAAELRRQRIVHSRSERPGDPPGPHGYVPRSKRQGSA